MIIKIPLDVYLPRKTMPDRKYIINLNNYRNWNFIVNNQIKQVYKENLRDKLEWIMLECPIWLTFTYFKWSNRRSDRANVLSIHEKFFCDALTEYWCIPDDADQYVKYTKYQWWEVDKSNPRVEVLIETIWSK